MRLRGQVGSHPATVLYSPISGGRRSLILIMRQWMVVSGLFLLSPGAPALLPLSGMESAANPFPEAQDEAAKHNQRGVELARQGDHLGAIAEFRSAINIRPNDGEAQYNLGLSLEEIGDLDQA